MFVSTMVETSAYFRFAAAKISFPPFRRTLSSNENSSMRIVVRASLMAFAVVRTTPS